MSRVQNILAGRWGRTCLVTFLLLAVSLLIVLIEYAASLILGAPLLVDMANTPAIAVDDLPNASFEALVCVTGAAVMSFILISPLKFGVSGWYRSLVDESSEEADVFVFFVSLRRLLNALSLKAALFVRYTLWSAAFLALPMVLGFLSLRLYQDKGTSLFFWGALFSCVMLFVMAAVFCVWFCQRYALAEYVLAKSPEISPDNAMRRSVSAMKGHCGKLLALRLRLLGYHAAELLIVPAFYAMPMRLTALALFADEKLKQ